LNVFVCVTVTVPPTVVVANIVAVPVVLKVPVPTVATPVSTVVSATEEVVRLVVVLVPKIDVYTVVEVPAVGPVTVLVTAVVPVTVGAFVIAVRVVVPVIVENVEVVLVELVETVLLVDEANEVIVVVGVAGGGEYPESRMAQPIAAHGLLVNVACGVYALPDACSKAFASSLRPEVAELTLTMSTPCEPVIATLGPSPTARNILRLTKPATSVTEAVPELPIPATYWFELFTVSKQLEAAVLQVDGTFAKATANTPITAAAEGVTVIVSAPLFVSYHHQISVETEVPFAIVVSCVKA